jgi:enoyl-CoA hydratase/carnithine racemase
MIRREFSGRTAIVRLDAPPLNLLGSSMIAALREAFEDLARESASVVVLFCAGGGAEVRELARLDRSTARAFITPLHDACAAIRALNAPVIAAIDGPCLGAHLEVAAACDLRICSHASRFGMPEIRVGIPSVIDACWLVPICGLGEAARLVYEGEMVDADEAERIGLVNRVVEDVDGEALAWAARLAESSPVALAQQKKVLRDWTQSWYEEAARTSIDHFERTFDSPEATEAMRAFLEKRPPRFPVP